MRLKVNWANPYASRRGEWLRGNLHTHTRECSGCSGIALADSLAGYAKAGYDFLAVSDHMAERPVSHPQLLLIPGIEWNSPRGEHAGVYSFDRKLLQKAISLNDQQLLLHAFADKPALVILNHPNWQEPPHYRREQLGERRFFAGVEIYNAVIDILDGTALATDKWDYLLSRGQRVLGFASDDSHSATHIGQSWIMVRSTARTPQAVFDAICRGNFYATTGTTITDIRREGTRITVETADAQEIQVLGRHGVRLARVMDKRVVFDVAGVSSPYARFAAYGRGSQMAWTQPFFLNDARQRSKWDSDWIGDWQVSRLMPRRGDVAAAPCVKLAAKLTWQSLKAESAPEGFVNLHRLFPSADGIAYLGNRFRVARRGRWRLALGHDGGAQVFVDGRSVFCQPLRVNPAAPGRSFVDVELERGTHEVIIAFDVDHGSGWGIFFRFEIPPSARRQLAKPVFPERVTD